MTENRSGHHRKERQKAVVHHEHGLLLDFSKSMRLREMVRRNAQVNPDDRVELREGNALPGLHAETDFHLKQARNMIDCKINEIMGRYPEGKKNKLFYLRFGSVDEIKSMDIKRAFRLLGLNAKRVKLTLLAGMDYHGNKTKESV